MLRALGMCPDLNSAGSRTSTITASWRLMSCTASATPTSLVPEKRLAMNGQISITPLTTAIITSQMFFWMNSTACTPLIVTRSA